MALDWILDKLKAKPGHTVEFRELVKLTVDLPPGDNALPKLRQWLAETGLSPYDEIGAPRIGQDPRATQWFLDQVQLHRAQAGQRSPGVPVSAEHRARELYWNNSDAFLLKEVHGVPVAELARDQAGIAKVRGVCCGPLDFPGEVVAACALLPPALRDEARTTHSAEEAVAYAVRLSTALQGLPRTPRRDALTGVQHAVDWLTFWGSREFGFFAWF